jgi:hypothetical protein
MHLATDHIHSYKDAGGRPAHCRVRIYLSEEEQVAPVIICSELPNNRDTSVTYGAEQLAAEVIRSQEVPTPLAWIEHWPKQAMDGEEETFELVVFSSYEVTEEQPTWGDADVDRGRYLQAAGPC